MSKVPLTHEQRTFAADHHGLVYTFLNKNKLSEDEYYDVIIFGYLKAVHDYFTRKDLQVYSFATISWKAMSRSLSNYYKNQSCQKRKAEVLSIHVSLYPDAPTLEESIPSQENFMQQLEADLLLHELARRVSRQQMEMVQMRSSGYGVRDIARHQKVTMKQVKELLEEVHNVLLELCRE